MYSLPVLPYAYTALEPHFDAQTMELHHTKHHQTYLDKLNEVLSNAPELSQLSAVELLQKLDTQVPAEIRQKVRNFGGGYVNHNLFFESLTPNQTHPSLALTTAIEKDFGSVEQFKNAFTQAATTVFGSGWAWLVLTDEKLQITTTPNQDSPYTQGQIPLLGIDVWEHAYYLKYQNRRPEFIAAFWQVVDWQVVSNRFEQNR